MVKIQLSRGVLTVNTTHHHPNWQLNQLLKYAERINPKRAFLFVSKVLGKHIPVAPSIMQATYQDLAQLIPRSEDNTTTFIAMAETAVGLGAGIYRAYSQQHDARPLFVTTTRHQSADLPILGEFLEEHSHAQDQLIHSSHDAKKHQHLLNTETLILIDDEVSTGKTFVNLVQSLQKAGLDHIKKIITITLVDWTANHGVNEILGIPCQPISLLQGSWCWEDQPNSATINMPKVDSTQEGDFPIVAPQNWGREPTYVPAQSWYQAKLNKHNEKILVLGSGEYAWIPFLIAEQLEQQGGEVFYSSTTRSPIAFGHAIEHILAFKDNYGLNMNNYAYNVDYQQYDRILLVIETAHDSVDPALVAQLPNLEIISYV